MKETVWEHMSILLEGIAFFLVTIDLYGKARIEHLSKTIKKFKPKKFDVVRYRKIRSVTFYTSILVCITLFLLMFSHGHVKKDPITIAFAVWLVFMISAFAELLLVMLPYYIANFILQFIVYIFSVLKLEGIMLGIGTLIFVISKTIAYLNVH